MSISKHIGKRIKARRKQVNITQERLAEMAEISASYLSRMERGKVTAGLETYIEICKVLGVTMDYLTQDIVDIMENSDRIKLLNNRIINLTDNQFKLVFDFINRFEQYLSNENNSKNERGK